MFIYIYIYRPGPDADFAELPVNWRIQFLLNGAKKSNQWRSTQSQTSHVLLHAISPWTVSPNQLLTQRIYLPIALYIQLLRTGETFTHAIASAHPIQQAQKLHLLPRGESNHCNRPWKRPKQRKNPGVQSAPCVPWCGMFPSNIPAVIFGVGGGGGEATL